MSALGKAFDLGFLPVLFVGAYAAVLGLMALEVPILLVTPLVVGPMAALLLVLERLRPEREDCVPLDQPLLTEFLHFLFSFEFGYTLALIGSAALEYTARWGFPALWPTSAPTLVQLLLALFLYELTSY